jgi:hypothetical protein
MKKTIKVMAMLLFVVSMAALTSCKKENKNLILGKWECVTASFTEDGETNSVSGVIGMVWEFKANGTVTATLPEDLDDGDTASYVVLDNQLTITSTDEYGDIDTQTYTIKELTKTKLMLEKSHGNDLLSVEFKKK